MMGSIPISFTKVRIRVFLQRFTHVVPIRGSSPSPQSLSQSSCSDFKNLGQPWPLIQGRHDSTVWYIQEKRCINIPFYYFNIIF